MPLVFARHRRLSYFYFCDTPMMAAILCYSGDSSDSVIATFSGTPMDYPTSDPRTVKTTVDTDGHFRE
jgi:hypothetical protein